METKTDDRVMVSHDTESSLEEATMTCLSKRFSMAASSTFNQGQLIKDIVRDADQPNDNAILAGTYVPPCGTDYHSRGLIKVIERLALKVGHRRASSSFSGEGFQGHWKCAREKTTSSIANVHFGHYMAIAREDYLLEGKAKMIQLIVEIGSKSTG